MNFSFGSNARFLGCRLLCNLSIRFTMCVWSSLRLLPLPVMRPLLFIYFFLFIPYKQMYCYRYLRRWWLSSWQYMAIWKCLLRVARMCLWCVRVIRFFSFSRWLNARATATNTHTHTHTIERQFFIHSQIISCSIVERTGATRRPVYAVEYNSRLDYDEEWVSRTRIKFNSIVWKSHNHLTIYMHAV